MMLQTQAPPDRPLPESRAGREGGARRTHRVRVCVIEPRGARPAYPRLGECGFDVIASLPSAGDLRSGPGWGFDVVIAGASPKLLASARFRARLAHLANAKPLVLVVAGAIAEVAATAARLGALALLPRDAEPQLLAKAVAAARRGETSYPPAALEALVRAFPLPDRAAPAGTPR